MAKGSKGLKQEKTLHHDADGAHDQTVKEKSDHHIGDDKTVQMVQFWIFRTRMTENHHICGDDHEQKAGCDQNGNDRNPQADQSGEYGEDYTGGNRY